MGQRYDIHCHIFNKDVFNRQIGSIALTLNELTASDDGILNKKKIQRVLTKLNTGLEAILSGSSEDVFKILDNAYSSKLIVTPLMFDLTYVDDNDGNLKENKRYKKRLKKFFSLVKKLLKIVQVLILDKEVDALLKQTEESISEYIEYVNQQINKDVFLIQEKNYENQIDDLVELSDKNKNVRPFFSIDPRRQRELGTNMLAELKRFVLGGTYNFIGVKLYAPAGFSPTDPILMGDESNTGIYNFCQTHGIPITVHCSNSGFACFSSELKVYGHARIRGKIVELNANAPAIEFKNDFFSLKIGDAIQERAYTLNHPSIWEFVLKKYPKLHLNLAHFGGDSEIMSFTNYTISQPLKRMPKLSFDDLLLRLDSSVLKRMVVKCYRLEQGFAILKEDLPEIQRKRLWLIYYETSIQDNWCKAIFDIVRNPDYPNAFTDLSCFSAGTELNENGSEVFSIANGLKQFKAKFYDNMSAYEKSKILYGSDFFLSLLFGPEIKRYYEDFDSVFGNEMDDISSKHPEHFLFGKS